MSGATPPLPPGSSLPTPLDDEELDKDVMSNAERESRVRQREVTARQRAFAAPHSKHADEQPEQKESSAEEQQRADDEEEGIDYNVTMDDLDEEDKALLLSDDEDGESITATLQRRAKQQRQQKQVRKQQAHPSTHTATTAQTTTSDTSSEGISALSSAQLDDLARLEDQLRQLHRASLLPDYPFQLLLLWLNDYQRHAEPLLALQQQHGADGVKLSEALVNHVSSYLHQQYNLVYTDLSTEQASLLSREERRAQSLSGSSLVYGEVSFEFMTWLWWQEPHVQQIVQQAAQGNRPITFVDLGAGTGKPSIATALLSSTQEIVGIELLNDLYSQAVVMVDRYQRLAQPIVLNDVEIESASEEVQQLISAKQSQQLDMHHGSILNLTEHWQHADVILINSTCFDAKLMQAISARCSDLKDGTLIVTFTKSMTAPHLQLVASHQFKQSWGSASIYIHQKVTTATSSG